jgi:lipopolysaccharide export LptBFGC system permease protein LptF
VPLDAPGFPHGVAATQVISPVVSAATVVALRALLWQDQVLPRSSRSLASLLVTIHARNPSSTRDDRAMTIAGLRRAASSARTEAEDATGDSAQVIARAARRQAAMLEVEIQKKYAMAAACVACAFFGAPVGIWIKRDAICWNMDFIGRVPVIGNSLGEPQ